MLVEQAMTVSGTKAGLAAALVRQLQFRAGGVVSTIVTVWLHVFELRHTSAALQVRVTTCGQVPFVTVLTTATVTVLHESDAVGGSKLHAVPHSTILLPRQRIAGGLVSTTVTAWLHWLKLPQTSVAFQVRVMTCGQRPLVTVLTTTTATVLHVSEAVGGSKLHVPSHGTVLLAAQEMVGTVVSI